MKRVRILRRVLRETGADRIWQTFLAVFFLSALLVWKLEPEIETYGEALWYCYAVVTTIGFGDIIVQHILSRIISILLSLYAVVVFAIITGVIVNYYNRITELKQKETLTALIEKLERLPELSQAELEEISRRVKEIEKKSIADLPERM